MPEPEVKDASQEKKGLNPILLVIVAVVVLALAGGGFFFLTMTKKSEEAPKEEEVKQEKKDPGIFYQFEDPFIVNLAEVNAERYLKVNPVFEVDKEEVLEEINKKLPEIKDILITIFSSKSLDDVMPLAGKDRLKQEIMDKVNEILSQGKVVGVYFSEFVIQ